MGWELEVVPRLCASVVRVAGRRMFLIASNNFPSILKRGATPNIASNPMISIHPPSRKRNGRDARAGEGCSRLQHTDSGDSSHQGEAQG